MAVNASFTGRTYPAIAPYAVGREKIREFAEAVGATDVVHTDQTQARARGYRDLIAQQCDQQLIVDAEAGIDFSRVVHAEQRFVHHRPITAGDEIVGVLTVASVREVGGHAMVTTSSQLSTAEGEPVCTATSTLVIRG